VQATSQSMRCCIESKRETLEATTLFFDLRFHNVYKNSEVFSSSVFCCSEEQKVLVRSANIFHFHFSNKSQTVITMAMDDYFADMSLIKLEEEIWRAEEALRMDMLKFGDGELNHQEKSDILNTSPQTIDHATEHNVVIIVFFFQDDDFFFCVSHMIFCYDHHQHNICY
jgi:hypothetical protein